MGNVPKTTIAWSDATQLHRSRIFDYDLVPDKRLLRALQPVFVAGLKESSAFRRFKHGVDVFEKCARVTAFAPLP